MASQRLLPSKIMEIKCSRQHFFMKHEQQVTPTFSCKCICRCRCRCRCMRVNVDIHTRTTYTQTTRMTIIHITTTPQHHTHKLTAHTHTHILHCTHTPHLEKEPKCWDPTDGEFCLTRAHFVEARSDTDMQVAHCTPVSLFPPAKLKMNNFIRKGTTHSQTSTG